MYFGIKLCPGEDFSDIRRLVALAQAAETAGWDAFFLWDPITFGDLGHPLADPWIALAAIAATTQRIRIGTIETPVARRHYWRLARETASLDHLSQGRLILGVGLGAPALWEDHAFGGETGPKSWGKQLDEGLEVLTGLWRGEEFTFTGKYYRLQSVCYLPTPVQQPRIPIWVSAGWPDKAPLRRAVRYDGVIAPSGTDAPLTPDEWQKLLAYVRQHRPEDQPFEAVATGVTPADDPDRAAAIVANYTAAGCTWWLEDVSPYGRGVPWDASHWSAGLVAQLESRIRQGPPRP